MQPLQAFSYAILMSRGVPHLSRCGYDGERCNAGHIRFKDARDEGYRLRLKLPPAGRPFVDAPVQIEQIEAHLLQGKTGCEQPFDGLVG